MGRATRGAVGAAGLLLILLGAPVAAADSADPTADPAGAAADPASAPVGLSDGVPHLPSPESLPPGTSQTPPEHRTLGYLRDLWHAVRTEDVSMSDALLLFAQRPMDSAPPAGMSLRPQQQDQPAPKDTPDAPALPPDDTAPVPAPTP